MKHICGCGCHSRETRFNAHLDLDLYLFFFFFFIFRVEDCIQLFSVNSSGKKERKKKGKIKLKREKGERQSADQKNIELNSNAWTWKIQRCLGMSHFHIWKGLWHTHLCQYKHLLRQSERTLRCKHTENIILFYQKFTYSEDPNIKLYGMENSIPVQISFNTE